MRALQPPVWSHRLSSFARQRRQSRKILLVLSWNPTPARSPRGASRKNSAASIEGIFRIGRTGVYCIRKPCPWLGIMKIREDGLPDGKLVWTGDELPIIEASPADRKRIRSSWQDSGCLLAQGRFEGQRLVVRHVTGDC